MPSIESRIVKKLMKLTKYNKNSFATGERLWKGIQKIRDNTTDEPPVLLKKKVKISKTEVNGHAVYLLEPLDQITAKHILYMYGGGYVHRIKSLQWKFLAHLVAETGCSIHVPIYPLAPMHYYKDVFEMLLPLYQRLIEKNTPENITIMGDSSGGSIALVLAMTLREKTLPQPSKILLISPALDMSLSNPELPEVEKLDPILALPAATEIGKIYAKDLDPTHYMISPIYGNITDLAKIHLFVGTHEICYPDAVRFKKLAEEQGIEFEYYPYEEMIHVWPILFFPESKDARRKIVAILND
ncbi:MAG: alpha/beta hydrolase fold domain-containing protein [Candidatus Gracilibacteria bacterium]